MSINKGLDIIARFKASKELNADFCTSLARVRASFPMHTHVNKFVVGMSSEYILCHVVRKHASLDMTLCPQDAHRNDICLDGKYKFSVKFKTPYKTKTYLSVPSVRLVNLHGSAGTDIAEDIFLIVPNPPGGAKGRLVFIPHNAYTEGLIKRRDGVDLCGRWITNFMRDRKNAAYQCELDIPPAENGETLDSIKILIETCLGRPIQLSADKKDPGV